MKKKLNLEIKDYRHSFNEPHMKKPYYLYVEWGNRNFYFSNKKKAERFLIKFNKHARELFKELCTMFFELFPLSANICGLVSYVRLKKIIEPISVYFDRYHRIMLGQSNNLEIGTEFKRIYNILIHQLDLYRNALRKNAHNAYLYENIRNKTKQANRLYSDFNLLLSGVDGINELEKKDFDIKTISYEKILKVA